VRTRKAGRTSKPLGSLRALRDRRIVVKFGGSLADEPEAARSLIEDLAGLQRAGARPLLVHGGGREISREMARQGLQPRIVTGLRVTDDATMRVVERVLGGLNTQFVQALRAQGAKARGFAGRTATIFRCSAAPPVRLDAQSDDVDLGFVGEIVEVVPSALRKALEDGVIPVVAPIGIGPNGYPHNLNADTAAGSLAGALGAEAFVLLSDVPGLLVAGEPVQNVSLSELDALRESGGITGGMLPKVAACETAVRAGVPSARIVDGRVPHALRRVLIGEDLGTVLQ